MPVIQLHKGKVINIDRLGYDMCISVDCGGDMKKLIYLSQEELIENINCILSDFVYFIELSGEYSLINMGE